jgi:hypothetical protein
MPMANAQAISRITVARFPDTTISTCLAPAARTDQPLAPIEGRRVRAVALHQLRGVGLDLMSAAPATHDSIAASAFAALSIAIGGRSRHLT